MFINLFKYKHIFFCYDIYLFFVSLPAFNHLVFDFIGLYFLLESKWDIQMVRLSLLCEKGQLQEAHLLQEPKCQWQNCKKMEYIHV